MLLMAWFSDGDGSGIRSPARQEAPACAAAGTASMRLGANTSASATASAHDVKMVSSSVSSTARAGAAWDDQQARESGSTEPVLEARIWRMLTLTNWLPLSR